mgnify:CR=1 FL=1
MKDTKSVTGNNPFMDRFNKFSHKAFAVVVSIPRQSRGL